MQKFAPRANRGLSLIARKTFVDGVMADAETKGFRLVTLRPTGNVTFIDLAMVAKSRGLEATLTPKGQVMIARKVAVAA